MAIQKPEWFKLDAAKFLSDKLVDAMSAPELGACIRLLCRQWIDGTIPDDPALLARLSRLDDVAMADAWPLLSEFFPVVEPGKRANKFMWLERDRVIAELERRSDEGTRAARKRWDEGRSQRDASANARANGSPMPDAMQDQSRPDQSRVGAIAPPRPTSGTRATQMPADFRPNDRHRALAADLDLDLQKAFDAFRDYHGSKGSTFKDWNQAFSFWLRKERAFSRGTGNGRVSTVLPAGSAVENQIALLKESEL